ncbi:MAG TPA: hypothetical protein VFD36_10405 [Kofleriaceae bacterium]|nr:hypothetical protein [Kofleriaceae bacterium]
MTAHVVDIEVDPQPALGPALYRWRCSCGKTGKWRPRARQVRAGGAIHQRRAGGSP